MIVCFGLLSVIGYGQNLSSENTNFVSNVGEIENNQKENEGVFVVRIFKSTIKSELEGI